MAHDYTELDEAISAKVAKGPVRFNAISFSVARQSEHLEKNDPAPAWRIVDRRLQALLKAGRIRYQRKPEGWVLGAVKMLGAA